LSHFKQQRLHVEKPTGWLGQLRISLYLLASMIWHIAFGLFFVRNEEAIDLPQKIISKSVKVNLIHPNESTNNDIFMNDHHIKMHRGKAFSTKQKVLKDVNATSKRSFASMPDKMPIFKRYDQLFPKGEQDNARLRSDLPEISERNIRNSSSFDPENEGFSDSTKIRNFSKLSLFSRDLADLIFIPSAVAHLEPKGSVKARYSRNGKIWHVSQTVGDPYYRAILYETLNALSSQNYGVINLASSEFDSVRIFFDFRTISVSDQTTKPLDIKIDGNKIHIHVTYQSADPKWKMLTVSPVGQPALNLLGLGLVLVEPYLGTDPMVDPEVIRLRSSPAFRSPIGS
jgi:hypothetical protein